MWLVGPFVSIGRISVAWVAPGPCVFAVDVAKSQTIPQLVSELILLAGSLFEFPNKKSQQTNVRREGNYVF